VLRLSAARKSR